MLLLYRAEGGLWGGPYWLALTLCARARDSAERRLEKTLSSRLQFKTSEHATPPNQPTTTNQATSCPTPRTRAPSCGTCARCCPQRRRARCLGAQCRASPLTTAGRRTRVRGARMYEGLDDGDDGREEQGERRTAERVREGSEQAQRGGPLMSSLLASTSHLHQSSTPNSHKSTSPSSSMQPTNPPPRSVGLRGAPPPRRVAADVPRPPRAAGE